MDGLGDFRDVLSQIDDPDNTVGTDWAEGEVPPEHDLGLPKLSELPMPEADPLTAPVKETPQELGDINDVLKDLEDQSDFAVYQARGAETTPEEQFDLLIEAQSIRDVTGMEAPQALELAGQLEKLGDIDQQEAIKIHKNVLEGVWTANRQMTKLSAAFSEAQARGDLEEMQRIRQEYDAYAATMEGQGFGGQMLGMGAQVFETAYQGKEGAITGAVAGAVIPGFGPAGTASVGFAVDSMNFSYHNMRGQLLMNMTDAGVNPDIADTVASLGALPLAGMEYMKVKIPKGILTRTVFKANRDFAGNLARGMFGEGATEYGQTSAEMYIDNFGRILMNELQGSGIALQDAQTIHQQATDAFWVAFATGGVLGGSAHAAGMTTNKLVEDAGKRHVQRVMSSIQAETEGIEPAPEVVLTDSEGNRTTPDRAVPVEDIAGAGVDVEAEDGTIAPGLNITQQEVEDQATGRVDRPVSNQTLDDLADDNVDLEQALDGAIDEASSVGSRGDEFYGVLTEFLSTAEADDVMSLLEARSKALGMSVDEYMAHKGLSLTRGRKKGYKGATDFSQEGKIIIKAFESADLSTMVHEMAHVFFTDLTGDQRAAAEKAFRVKDGKWTKQQLEQFATGFEFFMREGKAPTQELTNLFGKFRSWLQEIYDAVGGQVRVPEPMREVYNEIFAPVRAAKEGNRQSIIQELGISELYQKEPVKTRIRRTTGQQQTRSGQVADTFVALKEAYKKAEKAYKEGKKTGKKEAVAALKAERDKAKSRFESIKSRIRKETGQKPLKSGKFVDEHTAFKEVLRKSAQAARAANREGNKAGAAVEKARMAAILHRRKVRKEDAAARRRGVKKIKRLLDTTKTYVESGKKKGKFTAEFQVVFDGFRKAFNLSGPNAARELDRLLAKMADGEYSFGDSIKAEILKIRDKASYMGPAELEELHFQLEQMIASGRDARADQLATKRAQKKALIDHIVGGLSGSTVGPNQNLQPWFKLLTDFIKYGVTLDFRGILQEIDSMIVDSPVGRGALRKAFETIDQEKAARKGNREAIRKMNNLFMDVFGYQTEEQVIDHLFREDGQEIDAGVFERTIFKTGKDGEVVAKSLKPLDLSKATKPQLRQLFALLLDPEMNSQMANELGYGPVIQRAIRDALSPQDIQIVQGLMQLYRQAYHDINVVYKKLFGVDLPRNEFFTPIFRELKPGDNPDDINMLFEDMGGFKSGTATGSRHLKQRVQSNRDLRFMSDVQVFKRYTRSMEHFKAFGEHATMIREVLYDDAVADVLKANLGERGYEALINSVDKMAAGSIGPAIGPINQFFENLRINTAKGLIAVKPVIFLKQLVSSVAYIDAMGYRNYRKYMAQFVSAPLDNFKDIMSDSEWLQLREDMMERDISAAVEKGDYKAWLRVNPKMSRLFLANVRWGDLGGIIPGMWSYRQYLMDEKGLSKEEATRQAEIMSRDTQQSSEIGSMTQMQMGNSLERILTMFLTAPRQYLQKEFLAVRHAIRHPTPENIAHAVRTFTVFHLVIPTLFNAVASGFANPFDEDEWKSYLKAAVLGPMNGWALVGDFTEWLLNAAFGQPNFGGVGEMAVFGPAKNVIRGITDVAKAVKDGEIDADVVFEALDDLASAAVYFGLPGDAAGTLISAVGDVAVGSATGEDEQIWRGLMQFGGYSPWVSEQRIGE